MSIEANKALVRRFAEEVWSKGNVDVAMDIFDPDYIRHDLRPGNPLPGPEGQKRIATDFRAAFPDIRMQTDLIVAEGDMVVMRWTAEGTNTGSWGKISPTGKRASFSGVNIFRIRDGKVVELWNHRDDLGLMQQLGVPIHAGSKD
jgi:steroid delta-isomerase-like uncharacterized protein